MRTVLVAWHVLDVRLPADRVDATPQARSAAPALRRRVLVAVDSPAWSGCRRAACRGVEPAPGRLMTSVRGQPLRNARRKCARMFGYFVLLKRDVLDAASASCSPSSWASVPASIHHRRCSRLGGAARARQALAVDAVAVGVARVAGPLCGGLVGVVRARPRRRGRSARAPGRAPGRRRQRRRRSWRSGRTLKLRGRDTPLPLRLRDRLAALLQGGPGGSCLRVSGSPRLPFPAACGRDLAVRPQPCL